MPVSFKVDPDKFLTTLFGPVVAETLIKLGYQFEFTMYSVQIKHSESNITKSVQTPKSTGKIAQGVLDNANKVLLAGQVSKALEAVYAVAKAAAPITGPEPAQNLGQILKEKLEPILSGEMDNLPKPDSQVMSKPIGAAKPAKALGKVKLRDATEVGQPVEGTSSGSTYFAIAVSKTVKMAARLEGNKLSIRVEGSPSAAEQKALLAMGVEKSSDHHWSTHFHLDAVPLERMVGAITFGSGIDFDKMVQSAQQAKEILSGK